MRKLFFFTSILFLSLALNFGFAQGETVTVTYEAEGNCDNVKTLVVFQFNGIGMKRVGFMNKKDTTSFEYTMPASTNQFFYIGSAGNNAIPVILGTEEKVVLKGDCRSFKTAKIVTSDLNMAYIQVKKEMQEVNAQNMGLVRQIRGASGDPEQLKSILEQIAVLDDKKLDLLTDQEYRYISKIVALNTYLSYQNNGSGYQNEYDYFANEYFKHVDWKDEDYKQMAWVYEALNSYTETISMLNFSLEVHKALLEDVLNEIPAQSHTYQLALAGIITSLKEKNHSNFSYFAKRFVEKYKNTDPAAAKGVESQIASSRSFIIGAEAPDFTQKTPEGEDLSLSDLKGKIVLVDFWASWCGPCRRENPNVVKMYEKYKDQGFEILGVSLDSNKDRWLQAIKKDGLTWPQVGDLKGWQNAAAQMYSVRSIPSTVLVDAEGNILARNLRGAALEAKLGELFINEE